MPSPSATPAAPAAIKAALASPASCSPDTVAALRTHLSIETSAPSEEVQLHSSDHNGASGPLVAAKRKPVTRQPRAKTSNTKTNPLKTTGTLSPQEQKALATAVVNAVLQSLSEQVKIARSGKNVHKRLSDRSPNSVPPKGGKNAVAKPENQDDIVVGLSFLAECGSLGFSHLCQRSDLSDRSQLLAGIMAFIGKLVCLKLEAAAVRELAAVRTCFIKSPDEPVKLRKRYPDPSLAALLDVEISGTGAHALFLLSYQIVVMRTITITARPQDIHAILSIIAPSHPSSPLKVLQNLTCSTIDKQQLIPQVEALSRIMHQLAEASRTSGKTAKTQHTMNAFITLFMAALESRVGWMELAGHVPNMDTELVTPFQKCLTTILRDAKEITAVQYARVVHVKTVIQRFANTFQPNKPGQPFSATIYTSLSHLAERAGELEDAERWISEASGISESSATNGLTLTLHQIRVSFMKFLTKCPKNKADDSLKALLAEAKTRVRHVSPASDAILSEVLLLKKAALHCWLKFTDVKPNSPMVQDVLAYCQSALSICINCFISILDPTTNPEAIFRKQKIQVLALSTLESVLATCKPVNGGFPATWKASDSLLQECVMLLNILGSENMTTSAGVHLLITVSNMYWRAATEHPNIVSASDAILCRQVACDVLSNLEPSDKSAGHLSYKLHKLASSILSNGQTEKAFVILNDAIGEAIQETAFADAAKKSVTVPLRDIWTHEGPSSNVTKSLKALMDWNVEYHASLTSPIIIFDVPERTLEERSLLLELQLQHVSDIALVKGLNSAQAISDLTCELGSRLNDIFVCSEYPIRRLRVNVSILTIASTSPTFIAREIYQQAVALCRSPLPDLLGRDIEFEKFRSHLETSAQAMALLGEGSAAGKEISRCLEAWISMLLTTDNMDALKARVDNIELWISQLYAIFHFLGAQGLEKEQAAAGDALTRVLEISQAPPDEIGEIVTATASNLLHLGYSSSAGLCLGKIQTARGEVNPAVPDRALWHLVYAEYSLGLGNLLKYQEHLNSAQAAAAELSKTKRKIRILPLSGVLRQNLYSSDAYYLHALRELQYGDPLRSLIDLRKCISLLQRVWASIESSPRDLTKVSHKISPGVEDVTKSLTGLRLQDSQEGEPDISRKQAAHGLWPIVPRLHRGLLTAAQICEYCGMYQESLYFYERATRLATDIDAKGLLLRSFTQQGDYLNRSNRLNDGTHCLQKAAIMQQSLDVTHHTAMHHRSLGFAEHVQGHWKSEMDAYTQAETVISALIAPEYVQRLSRYAKHSTEPMTSTRVNSAVQAKKAAGTRTAIRIKAVGHKATEDEARNGIPQLTLLLQDICRRRAESLLAQGNLETAAEILSVDLPQSKREQLHTKTARATLLLLRANKALSSDSVLAMMAESTLAFPAISLSTRRKSFANAPAKLSSRLLSGQSNARLASNKCGYDEDLDEALQELSEILLGPGLDCRHATFAHACSTYLRAGMLRAYTGWGRAHLQPTVLAHALESPRNSASIRERDKARFENETSQNATCLPWPENLSEDTSTRLDATTFQQTFVDIIPESWTAISMALSEDGNVLYLVRYVAGRVPFTIQLPLARQDSDGLGEEPFTFDDGRSELLQIIKESNSTVHIARDDPHALSIKGAKTKWWTQREELDHRLQELLLNIEHVWLGGFKGIFSPPPRHREPLARFHQTFENILRNHLPSRNRSRKQAASAEIALDAHIFELFVGLGDPDDDNVDLDEPLSDLLYFVVDILQFHGEANAYDEIDFDSMIVDTQDALHSYHDAVKELAPDPLPNHTILILDKRLHMFPLESLPCLLGRSVSRLTSLVDLRERILAIDPALAHPGLVASKENGLYILNSTQDLRKTQTRFESNLRTSTHTKNWTSIVGRKPSEAEFLAGLTPQEDESKILLYFGHGSGAQYIRSKCIKRLRSGEMTSPSCNTALLFGCSSCSLTEVGEFEPYGEPKTYLTAGAPAVLGSLWDVTDGDCDVFAGGVLERWGLVPPGSCIGRETVGPKSKAGAGAKGNGKAKLASTRHAMGPVSLSDAAAQSRSDCYLPYLNGAAMVVYGVPVYLS